MPKNTELGANQPAPKKKPAIAKSTTGPKASSKPAPEAKLTSEVKPTPAPVVASSAGETAPVSSGGRVTNWRPLIVRLIAGVVGVVVLLLVIFGVLIYGYKSESPVVYAVSGVVHYPVMRADGRFGSYHDYLFWVKTNKHAYENNAKLNNQKPVDYNSADGKKLLTQVRQNSLASVKHELVVESLAHQKGVKVTSKDVNSVLNDLYKKYGGESKTLVLIKSSLGWDKSETHYALYLQVLESNLKQKISSDPAADKQAQAKAKDILTKIKGGLDFQAAAKQYSDASDASTGGDYGSGSADDTVTISQLPETEVQTAVKTLQAGQVSDPIKTQYGYEIVKVVDKTGDTAHVFHILIKTVDPDSYVSQQESKTKASNYIKI